LLCAGRLRKRSSRLLRRRCAASGLGRQLRCTQQDAEQKTEGCTESRAETGTGIGRGIGSRVAIKQRETQFCQERAKESRSVYWIRILDQHWTNASVLRVGPVYLIRRMKAASSSGFLPATASTALPLNAVDWQNPLSPQTARIKCMGSEQDGVQKMHVASAKRRPGRIRAVKEVCQRNLVGEATERRVRS